MKTFSQLNNIQPHNRISGNRGSFHKTFSAINKKIYEVTDYEEWHINLKNHKIGLYRSTQG